MQKRKKSTGRHWLLCGLIAGLLLPAAIAWAAPAAEQDTAPGRIMAQQATKEKPLWITADHSRHQILQKEFKSGTEVTKACLSCHNQSALQFHKTIHWTWMDPSTAKSAQLGKGGLSINNF